MTRSNPWMLLLSSALACAQGPVESVPPRAAAPRAAPGGAGGAPDLTAAAGDDAAAGRASALPDLAPSDLYQQCRERVEGRQRAGECVTDADCVASGCSGEVCLARADADGLVTTCEILPCFAVLDACGCIEGTCSWSVGAAPSPPRSVPVPLPPR